MAMEVEICGVTGAPEGAILSVRAGTTRRQAAANTIGQSKNPFRFFPGEQGLNPFRVDLLKPIGSARMVLKPGEGTYTATLKNADGEGADSVSVAFAVCKPGARPSQAQLAEVASALPAGMASISDCNGKADQPPLPTKDEDISVPPLAAVAKDYLERHNLLPFVRSLLQTVIRDRPEDPFSFIEEQFRSASSVNSGMGNGVTAHCLENTASPMTTTRHEMRQNLEETSADGRIEQIASCGAPNVAATNAAAELPSPKTPAGVVAAPVTVTQPRNADVSGVVATLPRGWAVSEALPPAAVVVSATEPVGAPLPFRYLPSAGSWLVKRLKRTPKAPPSKVVLRFQRGQAALETVVSPTLEAEMLGRSSVPIEEQLALVEELKLNARNALVEKSMRLHEEKEENHLIGLLGEDVHAVSKQFTVEQLREIQAKATEAMRLAQLHEARGASQTTGPKEPSDGEVAALKVKCRGALEEVLLPEASEDPEAAEDLAAKSVSAQHELGEAKATAPVATDEASQ
mmetsp:Transcript_107623/g.303082  ORF Transcript_107623/g.303082 Transcript_107623/m.303082 type:complete len:516 (-) Transcript_107623:71-1618(-)